MRAPDKMKRNTKQKKKTMSELYMEFPTADMNFVIVRSRIPNGYSTKTNIFHSSNGF